MSSKSEHKIKIRNILAWKLTPLVAWCSQVFLLKSSAKIIMTNILLNILEDSFEITPCPDLVMCCPNQLMLWVINSCLRWTLFHSFSKEITFIKWSGFCFTLLNRWRITTVTCCRIHDHFLASLFSACDIFCKVALILSCFSLLVITRVTISQVSENTKPGIVELPP